MAEPIDFYFDFRSPYSYLALTQLPRIAAGSGRSVRYLPVDVLQLMGEVGNRPTSVECPAKRRYVAADLQRWSRSYGVPVSSRPRAAESNIALLHGGAAAVGDSDAAERYARVIFHALWVDSTVIRTREELQETLSDGGVEGAAGIAAAALEQADVLNAFRGEAAAAGVFGVPSMVVGDELYFGNDRLSFLEQALTQ
jgi:2-hydroxychromene-2-carboxylate isomerase